MAKARGTIDHGVTLLILGIVVLVMLNAARDAGRLDATGFAVAIAVAAAALGWLAWKLGALPFVDAGMRAAVAGRLAKRLKGSVSTVEQPIWGGKTATAYVVEWEGKCRRYALEFDVTGAKFSAEIPGGAAPQAMVSLDGGRFNASGEGAALAERLLDHSLRAALLAIDRLKGSGDLSLHVSGGSVFLYKQQYLSASQAHELVVLGTPVIERAIALLAGQPIGQPLLAGRVITGGGRGDDISGPGR